MFKPARMTRVLIGGHKSRMADVIELLHEEKAIHLEDFRDPTRTTTIGTPLDEGEEASELLVRVRGMLKALDVEGLRARRMATADPAALVADAEAELGPVIAEASQLRADIASMEAEAAHLRPYVGLDVDLRVLAALRSVQPYMGTVKQDPRPALDAAGIRYEAGLQDNALILVVARHDAEKADRILAEHGYTGSAIPATHGTPARHVKTLQDEIDRAQERLDRAQQRIASHREQWGRRLTALEAHLAAVVERTQAPLSFAVTQTTFHIEGWIPAHRANRLENALTARFGEGVYFATLGDAPRGAEHGAGPAAGAVSEASPAAGGDARASTATGAGAGAGAAASARGAHGDSHGAHGLDVHTAHPHEHHEHHVDPKDEAPIKLENKGPAKPYEFMLGLLGRPRYQEIDPTKLMLIFFPLFFGLMVGDFLVGLAIMAFGLWLKKNNIFGIGGPSVGRALFMGGLMATLVGLFVFGEALGVHFVVSDEALEDGELSWEAFIYGKEEVLAHTAGFPTSGFFHKEVDAHGSGDHGELAGDGVHNETADGGTNGTADPLHAQPGVGEALHSGAPTSADADAADATGGGGHAASQAGDAAPGAGDAASQPGDAASQAGHAYAATLATATDEADSGLLAIFKPHGGAHLKAGPVQLGFYSKIHDIQALLAWSIAIAFVHLNLGFLIGIRNVAVNHGWTLAIQEKVSWITLQLGAIVAIWGAAFHGPSWAAPVGVGVVVLSIGLLWVGVQKALGAPGFVAILETLGFAGNILSYTRLAAIGASKAGMALAFAAIGFDVVGGGDIQSVAGWIVYLLGMVVITLLAILSGGLQSLRLQFVEFFQKFYEGGGRPYVPFGRRAP